MRLRAAAWARIVAAPLLVAAILWWADPSRVVQEVAGADPAWLLAGLVAAALANLVSALRWRMLAVWLGQRIGVAAAAGVYFRAVAISALLPGAIVGGDIYRAVALNRLGQPALAAGLSVLLDRLSGLWMLLVLGTLAAAWGASDSRLSGLMPNALQAPGAIAWAGLAACLLVAPVLAMLALRRLLARGMSGFAPIGPAWRERLAAIARQPAAARQYRLQIVASLTVQSLSIGAFALAGRALGVDLPAWAWAADAHRGRCAGRRDAGAGAAVSAASPGARRRARADPSRGSDAADRDLPARVLSGALERQHDVSAVHGRVVVRSAAAPGRASPGRALARAISRPPASACASANSP